MQSEPFHHLSSSSSYYGARSYPSHTVSQKRRFANQCIPAGYPERHVSFVPQAQTRSTHSTLITGSRSPSKLGLQAPHTWDPVLVWCLDLHLSPPPISQSEKSQNPQQERNKPSRSHKQVCALDNKSVTWLPSTATDGPQSTRTGKIV